MAKKTTGATKAVKTVSNADLTFGQVKVGEKFTFAARREGNPGRKPIFTKVGPRAYESRLGERLSTRSMTASVRKVAR